MSATPPTKGKIISINAKREKQIKALEEATGGTTFDPEIEARTRVVCEPDTGPWIADRCVEVLSADPEKHGYFRQGEAVVRVTVISEEEAIADAKAKKIKRQPGSIILRPATIPGMEDDLERAIAFCRYKKGIPVPIEIPYKIASRILSRDKIKLPALVGIIEAPIMLADGSILTEPGYDPTSQLYLFSTGVKWLPVKPRPSAADVAAAVKVFRDLLSDFPFATDADLAVAVSAFLTGIQRRLLPTAPLNGLDASAPGYGKTLLSACVALMATGRQPTILSVSTDEEEFRKKLSTVLMAGDAVVLLDNISDPIRSPALCSILTESEFSDRLLATMKRLKMPTNMLILASGNNLRFASDMSRRVIVSRIHDPSLSIEPEARDNFTIKDLRAYVLENRAVLVHAVLTILKGHYNAKKKPKLPAFGSFEQWSDEIHSAVVWAGFADPCETRERITTANPTRSVLRRIFSGWRELLGIIKLCQSSELIEATYSVPTKKGEKPDPAMKLQREQFKEALIEIAGEGKGTFESISTRRLGKWLSDNVDGQADGFILKRAGDYQGSALWTLEKITEPEIQSPAKTETKKPKSKK